MGALTFDKGSLLLVDYTATVQDTGEVFETTIKEVAEENSIHNSETRYQPRLVSIGEFSFPVLTGLGEALKETSVGDKLRIEVPPNKAFGERDAKKVKMIPVRKLGEDAEKVSVGDHVHIDNKSGIIRFISSGRVRIDFNHRHAGKTIMFDVNVIKSVESPYDRIHEILMHRFLMEGSVISFDLVDTEVDVTIPTHLLRHPSLPQIKTQAAEDIFKFVPHLERLTYVETHENRRVKPLTPKPAPDDHAQSDVITPDDTGTEPESAEPAPDTAPEQTPEQPAEPTEPASEAAPEPDTAPEQVPEQPAEPDTGSDKDRDSADLNAKQA